MTARLRFAACLAVLGVAGCAEDPVRPPSPDSPPAGSPPGFPQVLVVNTLSETLSRLDVESGRMDVQAAVTGTWTNRIETTPNGRILLLAESGSNEVSLLDAGTLERLRTIDVGAGSNPWLARSLDAAHAVVTHWLSGEVEVLDLAISEPSAAVRTTPGPEGFVRVGNRLFVACTNYLGSEGRYGEGRLDVLDLDTLGIVASLAVGTNPQDVALGPDGRVHVVCTGDYSAGAAARVDVVDPATLAVDGTIPLAGAPGRITPGPDGAMWVVGTAGGVQRYDPVRLVALADPLDPVLDHAGLSAIAADVPGGRIYVTAFDDDLLIAVDIVGRSVADAWIVGDGPVDVLVSRP